MHFAREILLMVKKKPKNGKKIMTLCAMLILCCNTTWCVTDVMDYHRDGREKILLNLPYIKLKYGRWLVYIYIYLSIYLLYNVLLYAILRFIYYIFVILWFVSSTNLYVIGDIITRISLFYFYFFLLVSVNLNYCCNIAKIK